MSLIIAELFVGMLLMFLGSSLIFRTEISEKFLRQLMRSYSAGVVIFSISGTWFLFHIATLGESDFGQYKWWFFVFFLTIILVTLQKIRDFLWVRGLAIFLLLLSNELLKIAYLEPYVSRLFLVFAVYSAICFSMVWGAWPYKFRDFLDFLFSLPTRARMFGLFTMIYGILVLTSIFW